jgi:hypothetical protein
VTAGGRRRSVGYAVVAVVAAASLLVGCGGDTDAPAADDRGDRLVRELDAAGYYDATGERDRDAVVRLFRTACRRLDAAASDRARYTYLVAFLRESPSIASTGGWPRSRVAGIAVPILCPAQRDVLGRAMATVS